MIPYKTPKWHMSEYINWALVSDYKWEHLRPIDLRWLVGEIEKHAALKFHKYIKYREKWG